MMNALSLFRRLSSVPGGTWLFSRGVSAKAPYFASIGAHVRELEPGFARATLKKRRAVENHLHTVHAIAMCNMAELVGGLMTDASVPPGARWIPSGMTVRYVAKAKTDLVATADGRGIDWHREGDVVVPIEVRNTAGAIVFTADITMNVKQKRD